MLISAVAFDLMDEAYSSGGFAATAASFLLGAGVYTAANVFITRRGAAHRKRAGFHPDKRQSGDEGSGLAIAVGAHLDGIPESVVIGVSWLDGGSVGLTTVAAVFLSNVPEGLSSAAGSDGRVGRPQKSSGSGSAPPSCPDLPRFSATSPWPERHPR